jgi:VanZ family protein
MKSFLKYWLPVLIWFGLIFIGSTDLLSAEHTSRFLVPLLRWLDPRISFATLDLVQTIIRKFGHVTEYAILAVLLWRALRDGIVLRARMSILFFVVLLACTGFAASDEWHQSFVPSRTSSTRDVMIDICGATVGLLLCLGFKANRESKILNRN